jgi:hypothetical protein
MFFSRTTDLWVMSSRELGQVVHFAVRIALFEDV